MAYEKAIYPVAAVPYAAKKRPHPVRIENEIRESETEKDFELLIFTLYTNMITINFSITYTLDTI